MVKLNLKADDDFEFFIEENEKDQIDKIEEIDLAKKPKRKNAKKSPKKKGSYKTVETWYPLFPVLVLQMIKV